jgi:hypothetical protein
MTFTSNQLRNIIRNIIKEELTLKNRRLNNYQSYSGMNEDDEDIVPEDFEGTTHMVGDSEEAEEGGVNIRSYYE